jgi:site-specific DNA-methyltransferase (adenine-specific)
VTSWRVIEGDCRDVLATLEPVDVVIADPPYGQTSLGWDVPVSAWLDLVPLKPGGSVWVFGSLRSFMASAQRGEFDGWQLAQDTIWEKHNGSSFHADRFRRVHEQAAHLYRGPWSEVYKQVPTTADATARTVRRKGRPPHMGEIEGTTYTSEDGGPRLMRSVIRVRSMHGRAEHPTQKPTGILTPLIEFSCPPGGTVLDPFAGSGSTLGAALETGRSAIGIEIDPAYANVAQRRCSESLFASEAA